MVINVTKSSMPSFEEYCEEIKDLWDSHWLTNMGKKHNLFQSQLESFLECNHVSLFANGHLALENIISAFSFAPGSEVITTPFTFASTTHAIVRNNLVPVFCDINKDDCTIDANLIEKLITEKTVAIIPVHVYGNICDVDKIDEIAKKYNLKVIYDAAHAFGVKYRGKSVANFGDASMFSFHATKVFNTIEGGAVCFHDDSLVERLNDLKNFGIHGPESVTYVGGNAKMNEFQAAMGICNLRHFEDNILERGKRFDLYLQELKDVEGLVLPKANKDTTSNYSYFPIIFDGCSKNRDEIFNKLRDNDIFARKYFYPITSNYQCYRDSLDSINKTPVAEYIADRVLTLPLYDNLEFEVIKNICDIIKNA